MRWLASLILLLVLADNGLATGFTYYPATQGMTWTNAMFAEMVSGTWERCDAAYVARPSFTFSNSLYAGTTQTITTVTNTGAGYTNVVTSTNNYAVWIELVTTNTFSPFQYITNAVTNIVMPRITAAHLASLDSSLYDMGVEYLEYWLADTNGYYDAYLATKSVVTNGSVVTTNYPGSLPTGNRSAFFQASGNGYYFDMRTDAYGRVYSGAGNDYGFFAYGPSNVQTYALCDASYTNNGTNANTGRWLANIPPLKMMTYAIADAPPALWLNTTSALGNLTVAISGTVFRTTSSTWGLLAGQSEAVTLTAANTTSSPAATTNYWYQIQSFSISPSAFTPYPNASVVLAYTGVVSFYAAPIQMTAKVYNERIAYLKELRHTAADLEHTFATAYSQTVYDIEVFAECSAASACQAFWTNSAETLYGSLGIGSAYSTNYIRSITDIDATEWAYTRDYACNPCDPPNDDLATNVEITYTADSVKGMHGRPATFGVDNTNAPLVKITYTPMQELYVRRTALVTNSDTFYTLAPPADWPTAKDTQYTRWGSGAMALSLTNVWMIPVGSISYTWATQYCVVGGPAFSDYYDTPVSPPAWSTWSDVNHGPNPGDVGFVASKSVSVDMPDTLGAIRWNVAGGFVYQ